MTPSPDRRPDPPVLPWAWLVVVVVCAPALVAGIWVRDQIKALADRSAIPARWRLPLLAGALVGLALAAGLAFRWAMGG